jgi:hypothetical protein
LGSVEFSVAGGSGLGIDGKGGLMKDRLKGKKVLIVDDEPDVLNALEIDMHESTVSRVTTNKWVHTPQGIFELKFFFNSPITTTNGGSVASESVKEHIRKIIKSEDPRKPYSDLDIVGIRRKELQSVFGVDFGAPGKREVDVV